VQTTIGTRLPAAAVLDALHAWTLDPGAGTEGLAAALESLAGAHGVAGLLVEVDAPPLRPLRSAVGTLAAAQAGGGALGAGVTTSIGAAAHGRPLGRVAVHGTGKSAESAAHSVSVAVEAVWARAALAATRARVASLDTAVRAIGGVLSVDRVLQLIVDEVRALVGARYAALGTVGDNGRIERFITSGITAEQRERIGPLPEGHGLLGTIIREARSIRIEDIGMDPRRVGFPPAHPEMHTFLGTPITVKGRPSGNLYLTERESGPFTDEDQQLVETFALHAGIAIENARLHEEAQGLMLAEERERIGQDLHDNIIQSLYGVSLSLEELPELMAEAPDEGAARLERAVDSIHQTIKDIRLFISGLMPEALAGNDVAAGLAVLVEQFRHNTPIDTQLIVDGDRVVLPPEARVQLISVAREALSNISRHARASTARVTLTRRPTGLDMLIEDDGVGFEATRTARSGHFGLVNMRARAEAAGATLTIDSAPGRGTRLRVHVAIATGEGDPDAR
jgi:signal transduction histidine kinase